jgi:hypothetical protein
MDFGDYEYYSRKRSRAPGYRELTNQAENPEEITAGLGQPLCMLGYTLPANSRIFEFY